MPRQESEEVRQRKELVLEVLRRRGVVTVRDIVEELRRMGYDVKEHNIKYIVKKLVREGKIRQHKCGYNVFYTLPDTQLPSTLTADESEGDTRIAHVRRIARMIYTVLRRSRGSLICLTYKKLGIEDTKMLYVWGRVFIPLLSRYAVCVERNHPGRTKVCISRTSPLWVLAERLPEEEFIRIIEMCVSGKIKLEDIEKLASQLATRTQT